MPLIDSQASPVRAIASLAALYIVRMLGLFMVLPVLALAGDEYEGSNVFLLGVALGAYGLTQALLQIPYGMLSDRFGRKPLIALGLVIFAIGSWVAASSETVEGLIVGRALQGAGAIAGVIMAMVADLTSDQQRTKAMASIGASIGVAFALSLVLGPLVMAAGGVRWIFWLALGLSIIGLAILLWLVPSVVSTRSVLSLSVLRKVVGDRQLLRLNGGVFCLHCVLTAVFVALPLMLESAEIPRDQHSWIYLGVMLLAFVAMVPLIIIGERLGKVKAMMLVMIPLVIVALLGLSATGNRYMIMAMIWLFFVGFNYLEATLPSLMSKTVNPAQRGAGSGLFSTCQFLGAATGGVLGGWLYSSGGVTILFAMCIGLMAVWWLLAWGMAMPVRAEIHRENVVA